MEHKLKKIYELLSKYNSFAVTFSGGIDSMLLLHLAQQMFPGRVCAVTINSPTLAKSERARIDKVVSELQVQHSYLELDELSNIDFRRNDKQRCYYCKRERIMQLQAWAREKDIQVLLDGSNTDDLKDYRPGMRAASEAGESFLSPFLIAGISKQEIRMIAKELGVEFWDLPSSACLASRIEVNVPLTLEDLQRVEAAEVCLKEYLQGIVRLRHHGKIGRIETQPSNFPILLDDQVRESLLFRLKELGYECVTLDLYGYKLGSMNTALTEGNEE